MPDGQFQGEQSRPAAGPRQCSVGALLRRRTFGGFGARSALTFTIPQDRKLTETLGFIRKMKVLAREAHRFSSVSENMIIIDHVLGMCWACAGHVSGMCRACAGHVPGTPRARPGIFEHTDASLNGQSGFAN